VGIVTSVTDKYQSCIDACTKCAQACYECFDACLKETNVNERTNCIKILVECAMMCQASASVMSMDGQYATDHCKMCATICEKCAYECNIFEDAHCKKCADICTMCAKECKTMANM